MPLIQTLVTELADTQRGIFVQCSFPIFHFSRLYVGIQKEVFIFKILENSGLKFETIRSIC